MKDKEVITLKGKIFIYYSNKGLVFRYPTGIDPRQQNTPENQKIIQTLVKKQRDIIYQYRLENGTNPPREYLKAKMKDESQSNNSSLMDFYKEFLTFKIKEVKNGNLKPQSLTDYINLRASLFGFEKVTRNQLQLSDVTEDMVNRFKTYLSNKRAMNNNSVKKRLKSFKIFLNYCIERKYMKLNFDTPG